MALVDLGTLVVPEEPLRLLLELEQRDLVVNRVNGSLRVSRKAGEGSPELSPEDRAAITRWKPHLLALVDWVAKQQELREAKEVSLTHNAQLTPKGARARSKG